MNAELFQSGERFHGYVIEHLLGKGGLGAVYLVRHDMLDTLYALKVLYPDVAINNPNYIKRFLREAKLATRIRHPNLVAVHDCGRDNEKNLYYLVMDYVPGGDLRQALAFSGKFEPAYAAKIVAQVASALSAAQAYQVVHRDIKPENIMLQADGTVKLVDLGIAKASNLGESLKTTTDSVFGTPTYVSPEQAQSAANVDQRSDVYSLGIVFFEMVTGQTPFKGRNAAQILAEILSDEAIPDARDIDSSVPASIAVLIRRMTVKDHDRRMESFDKVLEELTKLGYELGSAMCVRTELTPTGKSLESEKPLKIDFDNLPDAKNTLSMDTDDPEIVAFVSKLKRKRLLQKLMFYFGVALACALILIICAW